MDSRESGISFSAKTDSMYREQCVDYIFIDAYSTLDTIYTKDGNSLATRLVEFDSQANPHVTIDFDYSGKAYELKDDFKNAKELYSVQVKQTGESVLNRIDSGTEEYKNALNEADKLGFNSLPSCSSVSGDQSQVFNSRG